MNKVDIGPGDIRDDVRNGNEIIIDFHFNLIPKDHAAMAIIGIVMHVLLGKLPKCDH